MVIVEDITEERIEGQREKRKIKGLAKKILGGNIHIKEIADSFVIFDRGKNILNLDFTINLFYLYKKAYEPKVLELAEGYENITGRDAKLITDYSGITPGT